jgi:large subunit ribosomal protein L21
LQSGEQQKNFLGGIMKYAVIQLAGKQYKVTEGETFEVNKLDLKDGEELKVADVLLSADGDKVQVGSPLIKGAVVTIKAVSTQKGDKMLVAKYRAKSRYRKEHGHRQTETTIQVVKIA